MEKLEPKIQIKDHPGDVDGESPRGMSELTAGFNVLSDHLARIANLDSQGNSLGNEGEKEKNIAD